MSFSGKCEFAVSELVRDRKEGDGEGDGGPAPGGRSEGLVLEPIVIACPFSGVPTLSPEVVRTRGFRGGRGEEGSVRGFALDDSAVSG